MHSTYSTQKKVGSYYVVPDRYYIVPLRVATILSQSLKGIRHAIHPTAAAANKTKVFLTRYFWYFRYKYLSLRLRT